MQGILPSVGQRDRKRGKMAVRVVPVVNLPRNGFNNRSRARSHSPKIRASRMLTIYFFSYSVHDLIMPDELSCFELCGGRG